MQKEQAVAARQLVKAFNGVRAVDELDLSIPRGTTWGFIGPAAPARPRPSA